MSNLNRIEQDEGVMPNQLFTEIVFVDISVKPKFVTVNFDDIYYDFITGGYSHKVPGVPRVRRVLGSLPTVSN